MTNDTEALRKRLRWRVRRGTRELDTMIGWWLEQQFSTADTARQRAFDAMLDVPDPELWDWLLGHSRASRPDWQEIIDAIRTAHRL